MANRKKTYSLPDYQTVTDDIDAYSNAWRAMAKPVEQALGVTLEGFDPTFTFRKGNPQTELAARVSLPVWFVRDLSKQLQQKPTL